MQSVVIDSLEKLMGDGGPRSASLIGGVHASGFLGERLSLQIAVRLDDMDGTAAREDGSATHTDGSGGTSGIEVELVGDLAAAARLSVVRRVPVSAPAPEDADQHYLVTEPGEYPDVLEPLSGKTGPGGSSIGTGTDDSTVVAVALTPGRWEALWIDILVKDAQLAGVHQLTVRLRPQGDGHGDSGSRTTAPDGGADGTESREGGTDAGAGGIAGGAEHTLHLQIHPHPLPPLEIVNTHWFHADSLSSYYEVEVLSERHWELIEAFLRSAREMDVNSVLTPTWTPPLDTAEGHKRPTVQLVGISEDAAGEYRFDFTQLDRWLRICREVGMVSIEVAHLFTQWGARFTPAIQVHTADGVEDRFGWHVAATDPEYRRLMQALIPALREHLAAAWEGRVLWHISDEPSVQGLEDYRAAKDQVSDLLEGADVVDALSSLEFAEQSVVDIPIVATNHVGPFLEAGRTPWVYYCVAQDREVANRFIALPSVRNRVLGRQLFVHDAPGFLHWGYNFWWAQFALRPIDPFTETCAGGGFYGGDSFAVYPGPNGTPWVSLRHRVFAQGMADHRALTWLASLAGRERAASLVDEHGTLTYAHFSYDVDQHLQARRAVDEAILEALSS